METSKKIKHRFRFSFKSFQNMPVILIRQNNPQENTHINAYSEFNRR